MICMIEFWHIFFCVGLKKELISLVKSVSTCVRNRRIQILEDRRDLLLKKVSKTCKKQPSSKTCLNNSVSSVESSQSLLAELQDCESKLYQTHLMSSTPPKWLISTLANMAFNDSGGYASQDVFWKNHGHKFSNKSSYSQSVRNWYELLSSADSIISLSDWTEISNLEVSFPCCCNLVNTFRNVGNSSVIKH